VSDEDDLVLMGAETDDSCWSGQSGAMAGRTLPAWLSDKLGPHNTFLMMNSFTLAVLLAVWLPFGGASKSVFYAVTVLMGVGTGSFVPLGGE
jgi:sugar phosphate permease